jgi:serine phosphatase RsbU (regulator of sigma subunit)
VRYAGAGHPPLLVQRKVGDECVSLQCNGLMLGPFPDATYSSVELALTPGDRLLAYTDGILEATNARDEEFGEESLRDVLAQNRDVPAEDFAQLLLTAVSDWTGLGRGQSLEDDLTLVIVDA